MRKELRIKTGLSKITFPDSGISLYLKDNSGHLNVVARPDGKSYFNGGNVGIAYNNLYNAFLWVANAPYQEPLSAIVLRKRAFKINENS